MVILSLVIFGLVIFDLETIVVEVDVVKDNIGVLEDMVKVTTEAIPRHEVRIHTLVILDPDVPLGTLIQVAIIILILFHIMRMLFHLVPTPQLHYRHIPIMLEYWVEDLLRNHTLLVPLLLLLNIIS